MATAPDRAADAYSSHPIASSLEGDRSPRLPARSSPAIGPHARFTSRFLRTRSRRAPCAQHLAKLGAERVRDALPLECALASTQKAIAAIVPPIAPLPPIAPSIGGDWRGDRPVDRPPFFSSNASKVSFKNSSSPMFSLILMCRSIYYVRIRLLRSQLANQASAEFDVRARRRSGPPRVATG